MTDMPLKVVLNPILYNLSVRLIMSPLRTEFSKILHPVKIARFFSTPCILPGHLFPGREEGKVEMGQEGQPMFARIQQQSLSRELLEKYGLLKNGEKKWNRGCNTCHTR